MRSALAELRLAAGELLYVSTKTDIYPEHQVQAYYNALRDAEARVDGISQHLAFGRPDAGQVETRIREYLHNLAAAMEHVASDYNDRPHAYPLAKDTTGEAWHVLNMSRGLETTLKLTTPVLHATHNGDTAGWLFSKQDDGEVRARNEALCQEYSAMGEQDLLAISASWREMATRFTEATKGTRYYHGHILHDEEVQKVTKILETALSRRGIDGVSRLGRCLRRPDDDHLHWALATLDELDAKLRVESTNSLVSHEKASTRAAPPAATMPRKEAQVKGSDALRGDGLDRKEVMRCIVAFRRAVWEYQDSREWVELLSRDGASMDEHRAATREACGSRNADAARRVADTFPVIMRQAELLGFDVANLQATVARDPWEPTVLLQVRRLVDEVEGRLTAGMGVANPGVAGVAVNTAEGGVAVNAQDHGVAVNTGPGGAAVVSGDYGVAVSTGGGGVREHGQQRQMAVPKLSDTEANVIEALGQDTMTGEVLAEKAGYPFNSNFKSTLSSLRKRGILGNASPGYFVAEAFRHLLDKGQDKGQD